MDKKLRYSIIVTLIIPFLLVPLLIFTSYDTSQAAGPIIYVNAAAASGGDGSSWAMAYTDLQTALFNSTDGDQIWVSQGVYKPGNLRENAFNLVDGVPIYGGFDGTETTLEQRDWENSFTVLSGDIDNNDNTDANGVVTDTTHINGNNSYHVVIVATLTRLDGVTITGGKGYHSSSGYYRSGGGMYTAGLPTLANVTFHGNSAQYGGGLLSASGLITLTNVTFRSNTAQDRGGGMYNNAHATLTNVVFHDNSTQGSGGGMIDYGHSTLVNVTFHGNSAQQNGGGMYNHKSDLTLANVTFHGNSSNFGGGMNNYRTNPTLVNTIMWNNMAGTAGNQIHNDPDSTPTISYSLIQLSGGSGGSWNPSLGSDGGGNIDLDPLFVDPDGLDDIPGTQDDNIRLDSASPAIDAGDSTSVPPDTTDLDGDGNRTEITPYDLDNHPRFADMPIADTGFGPAPIVDMGAYEANSAPTADAGPPQTVPPEVTVSLDGSNSGDPDGHTLYYQWTQTSGIAVTLSDSSAVAPTFTAPATSGDLTFELTISDLYGLTDSDTVTITVVEEYSLYLPLILRYPHSNSLLAE